ncbi:MAG: ABC transporter ATP-binding protein [Bacteroidales bacterium]|nr:ABC transporter ATP-binding protein [Bacteroidales bacterium]MDP2236479.1 ABC transporter ATP-binding protein [Bacteroidales bacterium]
MIGSAKILELKNLQIGYTIGKKQASALLPPISLFVKAGEFVAVVGPNGAGKSTLLRTLTALQKPLDGEIFLMGNELQSYTASERALLISIVLTDHPDDFFLKAEDIVATGRYPYIDFWARLKARDREIIAQSMELCGITHLIGRTLISLSDGERQKVMIAKALAQDTPIIILDEPAAFLDYPSKIELMQLLRKLTTEQGKAILFSSHDLDLVLRTADRLWMISHDQPLVDNVPEQLVLSGTINKYFDRKELKYNPHLAHFMPTSTHGKRFFIKSDNLESKWVRNAFLRKGFLPASIDDAEILITFADENFIVEYSNEQYIYKTIETLINEIHIFNS